MNDENVLKNRILTTTEAKRRGRNGGIRSGMARKVRRSIAQLAKDMLEAPSAKEHMTPEMVKALTDMGINEDEFCKKAEIVAALILKAAAGDMNAYDRACKAIGEEEMAGDEGVSVNITIGGKPLTDIMEAPEELTETLDEDGRLPQGEAEAAE